MVKAMVSEVESLRKSLSIYRGLVEVSGLIASITDYEELLRAILDVARRLIHVEAASLFLVNEATGDLEMAIASQGEGDFVKKTLIVPKGLGIAGWVFAHGEALLIPDAYEDQRFYKEADAKTGFRTRSILCAPLKREGLLIGVLQVLNPEEKPAFEPEDLEAFIAYADLTATAIEKLRTLERSRRQERVERDLAIATEIQNELLSRAIPAETPGACFAAFNRPAANVGGDFYDVFVKSPYEIYFGIGDVSGKGIAASLLMAQTLSAMQFVFAATTSPADALMKLNTTLGEQVVRGMFVTMLIGRLTPTSGRMEIASAGHCHPVLLRADGTTSLIKTEGALPLGILPKVAYRQGKIDVSPGDWLISFTDGLTESKRENTDEFFEHQIVSILENQGGQSGEALIHRLVEAEKRHRGSGAQLDDLTILASGFT